MVRAKFAYLIGVSDAIRYMDNILMYYSEEPGEKDILDEEGN